ncbi:PD-(D/E)XK nuclease family protein [Allobaculum sp. Allo2]|uniref:PD-(D/E)XK nuclease family protein n=2 Tax=Allobaculum TaxID=174708 RepID=UPI001F60FFE1|nr:PD-(D/E)XK nuclease family protein [Allobaculum sp. Allo2]UNT93568.1 PD-(D/E)XK nuclease family protein [Allobaculum sp. Allo2]
MRAELAGRVPTYVSTQEKLSSQAEQLADSLQKNDIQPYHRPAACQHCPYKTICRNAAQEKE